MKKYFFSIIILLPVLLFQIDHQNSKIHLHDINYMKPNDSISTRSCSACVYDYTDYGSQCCDSAWEEYSISCFDLENDYNWDCNGCSCLGDSPYCGDYMCNGNESSESCPIDCLEDCGDGYVIDCSGDLDCCPISWIGDGFSDCEDQQWGCDLTCYNYDGGDCGGYCGDGMCNAAETNNTCPMDCDLGFLDIDDDGILDEEDNCPEDYNPYQFDLDNDGLGSVCDLDDDNDGILDEEDNCPEEPNSNQLNYDNDEQGDACDWDDDNDGIIDSLDPNDTNEYICGDQDYDNCDDCSSGIFDLDNDCSNNLGDLNADGLLNILDIVMLVNSVLDEEDYNSNGDINTDGVVNILDIVALVNIVLNP